MKKIKYYWTNKYLVLQKPKTFKVVNSKETMLAYVIYKDGTFKPYVGTKFPVYYNNSFYAPKVGMILDTYRYLSDPSTRYERRLIRYKIN